MYIIYKILVMRKSHNSTFIASKLKELWSEILSRPPPSNIQNLWDEHRKINNELEMLKLANCDRLQRQNRLEQLPFFAEWCREVGIRHESLDILCSPHGLCLSATEPLEAGAVVAEVPLSCIFSTDVAERVDSLKKILQGDDMLRNMDNVALAICVGHEVLRGSESKWSAYFNILPPIFSTPIFYSEDQFSSLKPSPVFEEALRMYRAIARQFVYFYLQILGENGNEVCLGRNRSSDNPAIFVDSPFTSQNFTFDFYRWCVSVVSTRINMIPSQYKKKEESKSELIPALIPFIDLANHASSLSGPGTIYYEKETNSVKLQLNKNLTSAEEVCIYYGPRTNLKFFLHNGFVPQQPNPDDYFELKIGLNRFTRDFESKMQQLAKNFIFPANDQPNKNVFSFHLKMGAGCDATTNSLSTFAKVFVADDDLGSFDVEENTKKARTFICDRLHLLLRGYKKTNLQKSNESVEKDIQRLKEAEMAIINSYLKCFE